MVGVESLFDGEFEGMRQAAKAARCPEKAT